jgi:hypothetical protein
MTVGDGRLPLRLAKEQPCGFDPGSVLQIVHFDSGLLLTSGGRQQDAALARRLGSGSGPVTPSHDSCLSSGATQLIQTAGLPRGTGILVPTLETAGLPDEQERSLGERLARGEAVGPVHERENCTDRRCLPRIRGEGARQTADAFDGPVTHRGGPVLRSLLFGHSPRAPLQRSLSTLCPAHGPGTCVRSPRA